MLNNQWVNDFGVLLLKLADSGHVETVLNAAEALDTSFETGCHTSVITALGRTGAWLLITQHHQKCLEFLCQCTAGGCQQGQPMPKTVHSAWTCT